MCGIFGHYSSSAVDAKALQARLLTSQRTLHHRGPDDRGLEIFDVPRNADTLDSTLSLGHTRLSIIDLTPGGHQPMQSVDKRFTIVFNGEIYNYRELRAELETFGHRFNSDSDTEVLLAAWAHWGVSGLQRLTGMFAFSVYDSQDESLTLVRDAFGIKPLFYALSRTTFCFASEVPALIDLLGYKPAIDLQQAYNYLMFGDYDCQASTFYQGVSQLLPAHWIRLDLKTLQASGPQRWWWPSIAERTDLTFEDAAAQLRELFLKNVRLHLRSDVPVGAALSGGLDSSAVVCAMRYLEPDMPIHTFTFIAPKTSADEEYWADIVNTHVGAIAHKVLVNPGDLSRDLDDLIRSQAEPFGGTSIYAQYRVFQSAREAGIVVSLDGQGADELLAGYQGYPQAYIQSLLHSRRYTDIIPFLHSWSMWPNRSLKLALLALGDAVTPRRLRALARRVIGKDSVPAWLDIKYLESQGVLLGYKDQPDLSDDGRGRRLVEQLRAALTVNGLPALLRHGDRNSMRWSIESRVPFLTTEMAELLLSLPESYLLSPQGETKHIFRAAMRGIVPDAILDRRDKIGFETPEYKWLRDHQEMMVNWLSEASHIPFMHLAAVHADANQMLNGNKPFTPHLWRLINFCRWVHVNP